MGLSKDKYIFFLCQAIKANINSSIKSILFAKNGSQPKYIWAN